MGLPISAPSITFTNYIDSEQNYLLLNHPLDLFALLTL